MGKILKVYKKIVLYYPVQWPGIKTGTFKTQSRNTWRDTMWQDGEEIGDNDDDNQEYFELELCGRVQDTMAMFMSDVLGVWIAPVVTA